MTDQSPIILKKVRVHNLKEVDVELPPNQLIVFTGVSGSGKSSLAFDTIYTEGQRRYIESLSTYARRHLGDFPKPDADHISGISPTIAIEQKTAGKNPRSTVGTLTGIYDFLRVLFARCATPHCPISGERVAPQTAQQIVQQIETLGQKTRLWILSPYARSKKGEFKDEFAELLRRGFTRVRLDGRPIELTEKVDIDPKVAHDLDVVIDRLELPDSRLAESVGQALEVGKGVMSVVNAATEEETLFSQLAFAWKSGISYPPLEPQDFSFNHPAGMCPACEGMGVRRSFCLDLIIDPEKSIAEGCCSVAPSYETVKYGNIYDNLAKLYKFSVKTPWKKLPENGKKIFLYGNDKKWTRMTFVHPVKKSRWTDYVQWRGVLHEASMRYSEAESDGYKSRMEALMEEALCPECQGSRIRPYPAAALYGGGKIAEITAMTVAEAASFFQKAQLDAVSIELIKEINERLQFLLGVGLHYLTIDRTSPTLSGGEAQRVRLASQIGSGLVGTTYVLDEPSIGLHPRDNRRLLETLCRLRDQGNTVIVVEHDEETIRAADYLVDVGPFAGKNGGEIVARGSYEDLIAAPRSITGAYLSGKRAIPIPKKRRPVGEKIVVRKAGHHNLKKIDAAFPLHMIVAVTGVSGSGKSSLVSEIIYPALSNHLHSSKLTVGMHAAIEGLEMVDKVIAIDQSPIGRTPRSNPATYIKLFDEIRDLFSQLPEAQAFGFKPGHFSFNVKEGSCPHCQGMGMTKIDMDFLEDAWVPCIHCRGKRFDDKTLAILYRGKSIHDVLEMTVADGLEFFAHIPYIARKLQTLQDVGLDYLQLGQPSPTLSGGEAQRIKLAKELSRPSTGKTFYILDEPTTGLHFYDIEKLAAILQSLADRGNTIVVIEHNIDLVKTADYVIELGPEGGSGGGKIVAEGTPEEIARLGTATGEALRQTLSSQDVSLPKAEPILSLSVKGAEQNNLKNVSAKIPRGKITVCTGPSGSGKSSFAFDTVYAEGQRRYVESLGTYARQFVKQCAKPKVEQIEGLSPAIAIEQKSHAGNPRSTVGTMTETYDFLRIVYAHLGIAHSPETGKPLETVSKNSIVERLMALPENTRLYVLAPITIRRGEEFLEKLQRQGYLRVRLNGVYYELDQEIPFDKGVKNTLFVVIDRLTTHDGARLLEAVSQAASLGNGQLTIEAGGKDLFFNLAFSDPSTGKSYPPITPHTFSFNTEEGMCPDCQGIGAQAGVDLLSHGEILKLSPIDLMHEIWKDDATRAAFSLFSSILEQEGIDPDLPLFRMKQDHLQLFLNGSIISKKKGVSFLWMGLNAAFAQAVKYAPNLREFLLPFLQETPCLSCGGARINKLAQHVTLEGLTIADFCRLPIEEALPFMQKLQVPPFLAEAHTQLIHRLRFLEEIGLGYLSLDRSAPSLSGGETQRIRLSRQLGSGLTGCLYVLDEPTIGLHPHDTARLNEALFKLRDLNNTLLLVEHDKMTIEHADYILDFGPKAGDEGGRITARGTYSEILKNPDSLTGAYLSGRKTIPLPTKRRYPKEFLTLRNCALHNLKNFDTRIPVGLFTCVTGVSGSGKSSLISGILKPFIEKNLKETPFDKLIVLDQNPIGHTIRADVSTYTDLSAPLRNLFSSLPAAKAKGLQPKHFSPNHKKGMCPSCWGLGTKSVRLQYLPPVKTVCPECKGFRLNPISLTVEFRGHHFGKILDMDVVEAKSFFESIPKLDRVLNILIEVGLGYLKLGQEIASLSGGEQQRIRLSRELAKRATGKTLYLLDEPTVGLHASDIEKLLRIFHALVNKGNSLVVVEHHLDVMAHADWMVDLGPGAGVQGGFLIAEGTPEEITLNKKSKTALYLKNHVNLN